METAVHAHASLRGTTTVLAALTTIGLAGTACGGEASPPNGPGSGNRVSVELTPDGCSPTPATIPAGTVTFTVHNAAADRVTEAELLAGGKSVAEKEDITPGLSGQFTVHLDAGDYQISCPGARNDRSGLKVTGLSQGSWQSNPTLVKATQDYAQWTVQQVNQLLPAARDFAAAVQSGDLAKAQQLYASTRVYYEHIEPVAEKWKDLDGAIDGRADDAGVGFTGFHRIEQALWEQKSLDGLAPIAAGLVTDIERLQQAVASLDVQPAEVADGATELINEIQSRKVTGEEERYSHTDLSDFQANLDGARQAWTLLQPPVLGTDPELARTINDRFTGVQQELTRYQQSPGYVASGFVNYSTVSPQQRKALAQKVNALGEALSKVSAKIA
jgi:iron uptake system component EfeO